MHFKRKRLSGKKKGGKVFKTRRSVYSKSQRHQRPKCIRGITCRYLGEREEHKENGGACFEFKAKGIEFFLVDSGRTLEVCQ